jgi:hypothetical protein
MATSTGDEGTCLGRSRLSRAAATRSAPTESVMPYADVRQLSLAPRRFQTVFGGLFLFVPGLVKLDLEKLPKVFEQTVRLADREFRQLFIKDLGHEDPTILLSNDRNATAKALITRYAQRVLIENALSDAVRFFHMNALSSAVGLKVDFDMALLVIASGLYRLLAEKMRGYRDAHAGRIFRDLINIPATVTIGKGEVTVQLHRRAYLPIIVDSGILEIQGAVVEQHDPPPDCLEGGRKCCMMQQLLR